MTVALYRQSIVRKNITWRYCIATIAEIEKLVMFFIQNVCMNIVQELRRQKEMQDIIKQYLEWSSPHHRIIVFIF